MKSIRFGWALVTLSLSGGCGNPTDTGSNAALGEMEIRLDLSAAAAQAYEITRVRIVLTHESSEQIVEADLVVDSSNTLAHGTIAQLRSGIWILVVELFENDVVVGDGTGTATVVNGDTTQVTITLSLFTGAIDITVVWDLPPAGFSCFPELPSPTLELKRVEPDTDFTRYFFTITNRANFPDELFLPAPDLAPCGLNPNASRTWVSIFQGGGGYLYGFCALTTSQSLDGIWFAVANGAPIPTSVYVEFEDRRCMLTYRSNTLPI